MLLLFLLLLALLGRTAALEAFDSRRCAQEMKCYVSSACGGSQNGDGKFMTTDDVVKIDKCNAVIAIRPYTATNWLIVMRGQKLDPEGLQLKMMNPEKLLFKCKPNGEHAEISVGPKLSKGTEFNAYTNQTEKYLLCEFEVSTTEAEIIPSDGFVAYEYTVHGETTKNSWALKALLLKVEIDPDEGCNPGDIQFESDENSETEQYKQVESRRFEVTCTGDDWQLTAKLPDSAAYSRLNRLACTRDASLAVTDLARFKYQSWSAEGNSSSWIDKRSARFPARCAQKRCLSCPEVPCDGEGCTKPKWTPGSGDSCANLECDGGRFDVRAGNGTSSQFVGQPICLDGAWSLNDTVNFTTARCFKHDEFVCPPISKSQCPNCNATAATAETTTCSSPGHRMTLTLANDTKITAGELRCDRATGEWTITGDPAGANPKPLPLDLATVSIACGRVGTPKTSQALISRKMQLVIGIILTIFCGGGLILVFCVVHRMATRPPLTPPSSGAASGGGKHAADEDAAAPKSKRSNRSERSSRRRRRKSTTTSGATSSQEPVNRSEKEEKSVISSGSHNLNLPPSDNTQRPSPQRKPKVKSNPPPESVPMEDDRGYVVIDPEQFAADHAAAAAKKAAAAAAAAKKKADAAAAAAAAAAGNGAARSSMLEEVSAVPKTPTTKTPNSKTPAPKTT